MTACMIGWAHGKFGKHDGVDIETMIVSAAADAIRDAGIAPSDIDEIYLGTFNGGFVRQDFASSLVLQLDPALRFKRTTRVENACATGSAAI
jgi:acetyl-CoA C-acetyltransferase